jgi:hypothetical protein
MVKCLFYRLFEDQLGFLRTPPDGGDGGDEEDRTPDLGIANAALSQLSYVPERGGILANPGGRVLV